MATLQGHHIPHTARSSFVGRRRELDTLHRLLEDAPLVTLQGPGGMGKTRLALAFAESLPESAWPGGIYWIDLSLSADLAQMRLSVAGALGVEISTHSPEASAERIDHALAARPPILLLLDNVEHLVEHAPETAGRWLQATSSLKILATSRERLGLAGERTFELEPLTVAEAPEHGDTSEAVELFIARARAARHDFEETRTEAVGRLVSLLDGIPLAIELAAAQMGVLTPEQLIARMDRKLDLLVSGRRDTTERHRTLRHALDGSWESLDVAEQQSLMRCSVFRAGFGLEAAEAMLQTPAAMAHIRRLRDASLLRASSPRPGAPLRFGFYASIQDYAREKLDASGLRQDADTTHAALFGDVGFVLGDTSENSPEGIERLALEEGNLSAALDWALADDKAPIEPALQTALMLGRLYQVRGPLSLLRATLDRAFALVARSDARPAALSKLLWLRGRLWIFLAERARARDDLDAALALAREEGETGLEASLLGHLATLARQADAPQEAEAGYRQALTLLGRGESRHTEGEILSNLAGLLFEQARLDESLAVFDRALDALRDAGNRLAEGVVVGNMGILHQEAGRAELARQHLTEALSIHRALGHRRFEGITLGDMASLAIEGHRPLDAVSLYAQAADILGAGGDKRHQALLQAALAACQARLGRCQDAKNTARAAPETLESLGTASFAAAARLYAHSVTLVESLSDPEALERALATTTEALDTAATGHWGELSDEVRLALRLTTQHLAAIQQRETALWIGADLDRFRVPGGDWVALGQKPVLERLFSALIDTRLRAPQDPISLEELVARVWPGERMLAEAATNRIHVSLSQLRKLGLKPLLVRRGDGYLIDPAVPVLLVP